MFEAFILVCSGTFAGEVIEPCLMLQDRFGPSSTLQKCEERLEEMEQMIEEDPLFQFYLADRLGYPDLLAKKGNCVKNEKYLSI